MEEQENQLQENQEYDPVVSVGKPELLDWMTEENNVSLYTANHVREFRQYRHQQNKGIDPITKLPCDFNETVLDHDHRLQFCRDALHRQSNSFEGLCFNAYRRCIEWQGSRGEISFPQVLRNLADYIEKDYSHNPYHPGWIKRCDADFVLLKTVQQQHVLSKLEVDLSHNPTKDDRIRLFRKVLLSKRFGYENLKRLLLEAKQIPYK